MGKWSFLRGRYSYQQVFYQIIQIKIPFLRKVFTWILKNPYWITGKNRFKLCHGYLNYLHEQETEGANENWKPGLSLEQILFPFTEYSRITPSLTQFVFHLQLNTKIFLNMQYLMKKKYLLYRGKETFFCHSQISYSQVWKLKIVIQLNQISCLLCIQKIRWRLQLLYK